MDKNITIKTEKLDDEDVKASTAEMKKPKSHRRKKLRRLAEETTQQTNNKHVSRCKRLLLFTALLTFTIALLMGHYYRQNNSNNQHILKEFLKTYRNQYTQIIHAKQNYCDQQQSLAQTELFERIKSYRIVNQDKTLQHIEMALRNESDLNAVALVGPVGVGKSLFMRAMIENFPWQENVRTYAWNTYARDEADKFHTLQKMIDQLSDCGQNLLVVEDLRPHDRDVVAWVNQRVQQSIANQQKRVIVFYVFSLNTMLPQPQFKESKMMVEILPDTNVIHFNAIGESELRDCIERELDLADLKLSSQHVDEIVATIDPFKSGCKNVIAKVLMFGITKTKDNL
uniref:AAA+ ATPase domain-containing protein n=1 Tax=Stomoxys calcitrans TaxID=35570 RepID=A0A1I8P4L8_STOCA